MTLPKQGTPNPNESATAPYNFVELPETVRTCSVNELPDHDKYYPERYTGTITCTLTTATPLYVRCGLTPEESKQNLEAKDKPKFYSTQANGEPVIPGSSLRGMMRSLIEIAAQGKVTGVTKDRLVYRSVGDGKTSHGKNYHARLMQEIRPREFQTLMRGGYLHFKGGRWSIQPAQTIPGTNTTWARIPHNLTITGATWIPKNGDAPQGLTPVKDTRNAYWLYAKSGPYEKQTVKFLTIHYAKILQASANPAPGFSKMAMLISGNMSGKKSEAVIFPEDTSATPLPIDQDLIDAYSDQISPEQKELLGEKGVLVEGHPVLYIVENGKVASFGHCMMMRLPYLQSPFDFVPKNLRREEDLDLAEAIFGYTRSKGEGKQRSYAGRVNFSDAHYEDGQGSPWLEEARPLTPHILGSPKPTTFQHYLVQRKPNFVQDGTTKDGRPRYKKDLADYASETPTETVIRGHKLYWHRASVGWQELAETEPVKTNDTQHTHIRPVKENRHFTFTIYFENLSEVELGALLWVLNVAKNEKYRLKLGMGKPLGMGSVSIGYTLKLDDRQARYTSLFDGQHRWFEPPQDNQTVEKTAIESFRIFAGIDENPRINQLLALLSWPGPDRSLTRYLQITPNEYKDRNVLPDPIQVMKMNGAATGLPKGYRQGTVKKFGLGDRGDYGYIQLGNSSDDVIVYQSDLGNLPGLRVGQKVIFRLVQMKSGKFKAVDIKLV